VEVFILTLKELARDSVPSVSQVSFVVRYSLSLIPVARSTALIDAQTMVLRLFRQLVGVGC
jgi:hypothetical protein